MASVGLSLFMDEVRVMLATLRRALAFLIVCTSGSLWAVDPCACTQGPSCCAEPSCSIAPPISLLPKNCDCNPCAGDVCCTAEPSCCQDCCCCEPLCWYGSLNLRGTVDNVKTRGFDTPPPTDGEEEQEIDPLGIGGALGFSVPYNNNRIRLECEGMYFSSFHIDTANVLTPFPPAFYSRYIGRWAVLANLWYDIPLNEKFDFYFGGGIGAGGALMEANDIQAQGRANVSDTVWQVGCGGVRHYDNCSLDIGYRFMDFGTYDVGLFDVNGVQTGYLRTDIVSHQLFIGFRYNSLFRMFNR